MSKVKEKPRNILKSVTCFNKILWLFGLGFPFDVENGKTQLNLRNRMRFLLNLSCSICTMVIVLSERSFSVYSVSDFVSIAWHYQYQLEGALVLPLMIFNYIKRKHVEEFLKKIQQIDELMETTEWIKFNRKTNRFRLEFGLIVSSILFLMLFQLYGFVTFLDFNLTSIETARTFGFAFVSEFYLLISLQFIFGTLCIYRRFYVLNMNVR